MTPEEIARAYLDAVESEERAAAEFPERAAELGERRAELHALLMQTLRENNIPFTDRADAAQIAYRLAAPATRA